MNFIQVILIGISLSMDAFSLSLVYGTLNLEKKMTKMLSIIVGCYHFIMPILGSIVGQIVNNYISHHDKLVGIIFIFLSLEMLLNIKELDRKNASIKNIAQAFLFGLSVSIDSFSVGIGLGAGKENVFLSGIIFSICSACFTYLGLSLGKKLTIKFGKIANIIGSVLLLILGIQHLMMV